MNLKHLMAVERMTSLLAAVLLLGGLLLLSRHASFSLAVGAGLMVLNAWIMRRTAMTVGPVLAKKPGLILVLFNFKLLILAVLIFIALHYLHVAPVPFIVGVSVLPVAIVIVALRHQLSPSDPSNPSNEAKQHDEEPNG
jgi:hypothetical protein